MIFGAGINQLSLIKSARELNVISVVVDPDPEAPGKDFADHFYAIDGKDYYTTKNIAINHNIDGVVTGQMEKPLPLMAKLAKDLGLIFNSLEVIEKSINKNLMKSCLLN